VRAICTHATPFFSSSVDAFCCACSFTPESVGAAFTTSQSAGKK
jgi:hypothetical protein